MADGLERRFDRLAIGRTRDHVLNVSFMLTLPERLKMADRFFAMRDRAYDLADAGAHKGWTQIASALQAEGFPDDMITRLDDDRLAVMMITRCCAQARASI